MVHEPLPTPTSKVELLDQIDTEYVEFTALLLARPEAERGDVWDDGRSFKDLTAHVADWEQYAKARISANQGTYTPTRIVDDADMDRVNAEIQAKHADLSWDEAWAFLNQSHDAMRAYVVSLPEEDIFDTSRAPLYVGDDDNYVLDVILWNTSQHYREHADEIRATT